MLFRLIVGAMVESVGWKRSRSSVGSGRVFRDDSAATCSMLTSVGELSYSGLKCDVYRPYLCLPVQERRVPMPRRTLAWKPLDVN